MAFAPFDFLSRVGDKRTALRPGGNLMNFGIMDNYPGLKCNEPHPVKICVEYYDAPALAGVVFGPEAYASDATNGIGCRAAACGNGGRGWSAG